MGTVSHSAGSDEADESAGNGSPYISGRQPEYLHGPGTLHLGGLEGWGPERSLPVGEADLDAYASPASHFPGLWVSHLASMNGFWIYVICASDTSLWKYKHSPRAGV